MINQQIDQLEHLSLYAAYLLENQLKNLAKNQLDLSHKLHLPLLEFFKQFTEGDLLGVGEEGIKDLLLAMKNYSLNEYIDRSIPGLHNDQISYLVRDRIAFEDIMIVSFMRRKMFRDHLPCYSNDLALGLKIMEELDLFLKILNSKIFEILSQIASGLFEQAQAVAHIGNWVMDLKTSQISWSKEVFNIYQLPFQDKVTYDLASFNHPDDKELVTESLRSSREKLLPVDFVYRIVTSSGNIRFLHARVEVFANKQGEAEKMFGTVQDVTNQKIMERQLLAKSSEIKSQEDRYHRMFNEVEDYAILMLSRDGIIENWNVGAEKIKGYKAEEIIGNHLRIFYSKEDQEQKLPEQLIEHAFRYGKANHEGWRIRKDRSRFWGNIVITAIHDEHGEVVGFSKMTRDLTIKKIAEDSLKQYSARLEQQNAELEQKNKDLESFNYIAGHDLQEPVRKIRVWLNKINEIPDIGENITFALSRIKASTERMQLLISGLLEYAQTDLSDLKRERIDLNVILDEVFADLSEIIEQRDIHVTRNQFPTIMGIRIQFYQLFFNIISNSIKYGKPDSPLSIHCSASVIISGPAAAPSHQFIVSDTGIGFMQEYGDKIFELFKRLDPTFAPEGTGLGLAICKKIVQNHQGTISAKGELGRGASIEVIFPFC